MSKSIQPYRAIIVGKNYQTLVAALGVGVVLMLVAFVIGSGYLKKKMVTEMVIEARSFHMSALQAALDFSTAAEGVGYPADSGIVSAREYVGKLVAGGYLAKSNGDAILERYYIGNVSEKDLAHTIFLRPKPGKQRMSGAISYPLKEGPASLDPPRTPAYLPD